VSTSPPAARRPSREISCACARGCTRRDARTLDAAVC
jgi:hypothetical protein